MSGAIGRIPKELYESAELDGAGYFVEFTKITIPLIWPTIVTLVVLGMTNVLTLYLQPYLLTNGTGSGLTYSLAMDIFISTASGQQSAYCTAAAEGLLFSVIWAPIVLLVRSKMSKKFDGIDF
jgi:ABC-type sugar transport system permease subunit